ncbi:type IX secretion system membrane protein PorP/SprF [Runella aurantiaca]|uniref:Type IX secretion system membrane protein PorP/SprF n=2 Tax=Runella aurantiaca TaxID=2282308 RepID=A0A369I789_9BACT|nr:type IX secretion system membrane protein PorP/SprF [Runella aurantiaca]
MRQGYHLKDFLHKKIREMRYTKMLSVYLCFSVVCCSTIIWGQQLPQYSQYLQNNFLLNPALAGIESYADAKIGYRQQWAGLEDAPRTLYMTAHLPIGNPDFEVAPASPRFSYGRQRGPILPDAHGGAGVSLIRDQTGPWTRFSMSVSGAYHYPLNDEWQVSAGLAAGVTQHTLDFDRIRLANPLDPVVSVGKVNTFRPDLHAGLWVYSTDFFAGFSVQQVLGGKLRFRSTSYDWQGQLVPHYFLTAGYRLPINDEWDFTPSVLFKKSAKAPTSWDLNFKFSYLNQLWFGMSYRKSDAFLGWVGTRVAQKFTVSYTYEYVLSSLQSRAQGSHEITLGLTLGGSSHYSSPRVFW